MLQTAWNYRFERFGQSQAERKFDNLNYNIINDSIDDHFSRSIQPMHLIPNPKLPPMPSQVPKAPTVPYPTAKDFSFPMATPTMQFCIFITTLNPVESECQENSINYIDFTIKRNNKPLFYSSRYLTE